jgi:predicted DNA-binding protein
METAKSAKRISKLTEPLKVRLTKNQFNKITNLEKVTGYAQAQIIRDLLDDALGLSSETHQTKEIEKLENVINELLAFYSDIAMRGVLSDEDKDRLNKIQEDL